MLKCEELAKKTYIIKKDYNVRYTLVINIENMYKIHICNIHDYIINRESNIKIIINTHL